MGESDLAKDLRAALADYGPWRVESVDNSIFNGPIQTRHDIFTREVLPSPRVQQEVRNVIKRHTPAVAKALVNFYAE